MRIYLELVRILALFSILGYFLSMVSRFIYEVLGMNVGNNEWLLSIAILILLFVLYREKLQFSGWSKGKGREKLPKTVTQVLISCTVLLLILVPFL